MRRVIAAAALCAVASLAETQLRFEAQDLDPDFGIGYALLAEDFNGDGKIDVFAINETQAAWWENGSWTKHVVLDGKTEADNVCVAAHDIDGDGNLDVALGAAWRPRDTQGGGTLQWIRPTGSPSAPWELHPLGAEPTLHRIRWADVDGDGSKELIVAPLHGRGTAGPKHWEGAGVRLLALRPPADPTSRPWNEEVVDDSLHVLHNFWVVDFDGDRAEEILTASYEGVHLLDRAADRNWKRTKLGDGFQSEEIRGAGEIKLGRLKKGNRRYIATVEPWHANHVVIYLEPEKDPTRPWRRLVVADRLGAGHALWTADLDGDGDDELIVGWREAGEGEFAKPGLAIFDPGDWTHQIIDSGGMATEDIVAADFNGDGKIDIAAAGRATRNIRIYWRR